MAAGYRCVFVDWHNTLSVSRFWGHLEGGTPEERRLFRRIEAALYGKLGDLLTPWMRGGLTTEGVMRAVAREAGLDDGLVLREFIVGCERMRFADAAIPDLVLALRASGRRVVIATDNYGLVRALDGAEAGARRDLRRYSQFRRVEGDEGGC